MFESIFASMLDRLVEPPTHMKEIRFADVPVGEKFYRIGENNRYNKSSLTTYEPIGREWSVVHVQDENFMVRISNR